ncbi:Rad17 cell cycle checkpoint protein-domain-containing protein, partial [Coniella lustricola]
PPAKRRKRNIVEDTDTDQHDKPSSAKKKNLEYYFSSPEVKDRTGCPATADITAPDSPSPLRRAIRSSRGATLANAPAAATQSRQSKVNLSKSPSHSPLKPKKPIEEGGKSGNIKTLFSKQSQKAKREPNADGHRNTSHSQVFDIVNDPLSEDDDEDISAHRASGTSLVGKKAQKRLKEPDEASTTLTASSSQRFLHPTRTTSASSVSEGGHGPWSERYGPDNLDELVVHKRKVEDVRRWLEGVLSGRLRQCLLVLKGSAGTGKTTTMQLLSRDMGFEVLEWRNPGATSASVPGAQSSAARFEEFLGRGRSFGQLDIDESDSNQKSQKANGALAGLRDDDRKRVVVIEEFPNTFIRSGNGVMSFRSTLRQFLAHNTPTLGGLGEAGSVIPVIMIISETLLTTTSASADSFTAHRLLGPEILRHPGTGVIEFNDIAPTLLAKALELVVRKEARVSGRRRTPGPQVLRRLGEIGDIRNAVSTLEFLCLKGDEEADWGSKVTFGKSKKTSKSQAMTKGEQESLELVSQREYSLGIFHAIGKVVYNKRDEQPFPQGSVEALAEALPSHLSHMRRDKRSQVSLTTLIDETGTDTSTFISALHENYVPSCDRTGVSDSQTSLDYINSCLDYLSASDLLSPSWDTFSRGGALASRDQGSHILRQDEIAFEVAVRGLLFSLPHPVKRKSNLGGKTSDAFKMFYPASIKLWKTKEELDGLVDWWASRILKQEPSASDSKLQQPFATTANSASLFRKGKSAITKSSGTESQQDEARKNEIKSSAEPSAEEALPLLSLGSSARQELVLERLPYMSHLARHGHTSLMSLDLHDLERVVTFRGIGASVEEESEEEREGIPAPTGEAWATDKPTEDSTPRKKPTNVIKSQDKQSEGSMISNLQVHKLVLSDDDIEDD